MNIVLLPISIIACWLLYSVLSGLWHVWMLHRHKIALLRDYERNPSQYTSWDEFHQNMNAKLQEMGEGHPQPEFRLTGALTVLIGAMALSTAYYLQIGESAVALYIGGIASIIVGALLIAFGQLLKSTRRTPTIPSTTD